MGHAAGTFSVKAWDESTYQELDDSAKLTKASVEYAMEGDLSAVATWDAVMYYRPDGTAVYTGVQLMKGQLDGREGSFVVQADGEYADGEARSSWRVVPGSGTGGLAGLTGSGTSVASKNPPGTYDLDYAFA